MKESHPNRTWETIVTFLDRDQPAFPQGGGVYMDNVGNSLPRTYSR